jgi:hypothetical protein
MIVQRVTVRVPLERIDTVVDVLKAQRAQMDDPSTMRIYKPNMTPSSSVVVYELDAENLADLEQGWDEFFARPETAQFMEHWMELVDDWGSEVWDVVE